MNRKGERERVAFRRDWSIAYSVNNAGIAVGLSVNTAGIQHAFHREDGEMIDLAPVLADIGITGLSQALGVNVWGDIVGWGDDAAGKPHAFLLAIPEPSNLLLFAAGGVALAWRRHRDGPRSYEQNRRSSPSTGTGQRRILTGCIPNDSA